MPDTYGGGTAIDWATFLAGIYNSQKKGSFKQVPMSPQQQGLFNWSYGNLQNTPSSSQALFPIASHYVSNPSTIDVAALKRGDIGYHPGAPLSASDLAGVLNPKPSGATAGPGTSVGGPVASMPNGGGSDMSGTGAQDIQPGMSGRKDRLPNMYGSTGSLIGSSPGSFDPNMNGRPGVTSPAGENPNAIDIKNRNDSGYGSPSGNDTSKPGLNSGDAMLDYAYNYLKDNPQGQSWWASFTSSHPNWMKDAANAAAAIAAKFNIPLAIALKLVGTLIPTHTTPPVIPPATPPATGHESTIAQASGLKNAITAQPRYIQAQRPPLRDLSAGNY